mgnify:CR=1 FL=1
MINYLYKNFYRSCQLLFLRVGLGKSNYKNFKDLNFKQNDFINYKIVKYYVQKNNFINNINIQDVHTFNFLSFYQKLGGKKGIELSKSSLLRFALSMFVLFKLISLRETSLLKLIV